MTENKNSLLYMALSQTVPIYRLIKKTASEKKKYPYITTPNCMFVNFYREKTWVIHHFHSQLKAAETALRQKL
jgi:hypothetical protein